MQPVDIFLEGKDAQGVVGFISWQRLIKLFRQAQEIKKTETVTSLRLDDRGITYRIKN